MRCVLELLNPSGFYPRSTSSRQWKERRLVLNALEMLNVFENNSTLLLFFSRNSLFVFLCLLCPWCHKGNSFLFLVSYLVMDIHKDYSTARLSLPAQMKAKPIHPGFPLIASQAVSGCESRVWQDGGLGALRRSESKLHQASAALGIPSCSHGHSMCATRTHSWLLHSAQAAFHLIASLKTLSLNEFSNFRLFNLRSL